MNKKITQKQWDKVWTKYKNLMFSIAYRIGGDSITNSIEDSIQELSITALDACAAYKKKTGQTFNQYINTENFNKYIKTCLWNKKNNNGLKIEKKREINRHLSLNEQIAETNWSTQSEACPVSALVDDVELNSQLSSVRDIILEDASLIKPNGTINISKLSLTLGKTKQETKKAIEELKFHYRDFNELNHV